MQDEPNTGFMDEELDEPRTKPTKQDTTSSNKCYDLEGYDEEPDNDYTSPEALELSAVYDRIQANNAYNVEYNDDQWRRDSIHSVDTNTNNSHHALPGCYNLRSIGDDQDSSTGGSHTGYNGYSNNYYSPHSQPSVTATNPQTNTTSFHTNTNTNPADTAYQTYRTQSDADETFQQGWDHLMGDHYKIIHKRLGQSLIVQASIHGSCIARGFCAFRGWGAGSIGIPNSIGEANEGDGGDLKRHRNDYSTAFGIFSDLVESVEQTPGPETIEEDDDNSGDRDRERESIPETNKRTSSIAYVNAMAMLGYFYKNGWHNNSNTAKPNPNDTITAIQWFAAAAKRQHSWSMAMLAFCYQEGVSNTQMVRDDLRAFRLYHKSAELGYAKAMVSVANIYLRGSDGGGGGTGGSTNTNTGSNLVVVANLGKALLYYKKAAKMDHAGAIERVKELQGEHDDGDGGGRGRRKSRLGGILRKVNRSKSRDGKSVGQSVVSGKSANSGKSGKSNKSGKSWKSALGKSSTRRSKKEKKDKKKKNKHTKKSITDSGSTVLSESSDGRSKKSSSSSKGTRRSRKNKKHSNHTKKDGVSSDMDNSNHSRRVSTTRKSKGMSDDMDSVDTVNSYDLSGKNSCAIS